MADLTPGVPTRRVDNTLAWAMAFVPLIAILPQVGLAVLLHSTIADQILIPMGLYIILGTLDLSRLKAAGYSTRWLWLWLALLAPVYLAVRARRVRQRGDYAVAWFAVAVVSLLLYALLGTAQGVPGG